MNQINDPDEISYKGARRKIGRLAPIVLTFDVLLALLIWVFRGSIFNEPQADYLGTMIAVALMAAGVFSYFILKAMEKRIVNSKLNKETMKDVEEAHEEFEKEHKNDKKK
jgi:hypothetical protein